MTIAELLALLISAQKLTGQSSYERRAPAPKAVPALLAAKSEITRFLAENSESAEAYRLLSLAQECLLNFRGARTSLERAMSLSAQRNPKDLKHLALLREYESKWEALPLTNERDFPVPSGPHSCGIRHPGATMGSSISHQLTRLLEGEVHD